MLAGKGRGPAGTLLPDASNDPVGLPSLSIGKTCDVVNQCSPTFNSILYTNGLVAPPVPSPHHR